MRSISARWALLLLIPSLAAATPATPATPTAPNAAAQTEFSERIDVRALDIEAVVTDAKGGRVKDLKAEDFRLLVDGREERIDSFSEVREGQTEPTAPAIPMASTTATTSAESSVPAPALSPGATPEKRVGTNYLVFIDEALALASERNATLWTLNRDLALLGPGDRMSIVVFDGTKLVVLAGWTEDLAVLRETLTAASKRGSEGIFAYVSKKKLDRGGDPRAAAIDYRAFYGGGADPLGGSPVGRIWGLARGGDTVRKVATAAAYALRAMPLPEGRRVMMVLAGDWSYNGGPESLRPLTTSASLLGYTIYPINVTGLRLLTETADSLNPGRYYENGYSSESFFESSRYYSGHGAPETFTDPSQYGRQYFPERSRRYPEDQYAWPTPNGFEGPSDSALKALAQATGGVVSWNRDHSLRQVAADTRSYYRLGFSPIWKADDRPRDIRLEVRRPKLTVRTQSRFFDLSPATNGALTAESVLSLGGDPARKRLVVTAGAPRRSGREGLDLPVTFAIPSELLERVPGAGPGYRVEGSLAVAALDVQGRRIAVPGQMLHGTLPEAPRPGVFVRIRSVLHLRRAQQRLVFTVSGVEASPIWNDLEVNP